jgi:hypothetical protein
MVVAGVEDVVVVVSGTSVVVVVVVSGVVVPGADVVAPESVGEQAATMSATTNAPRY